MQQVEYYFSDDNLARDAFLRGRLEQDGFVPLATLATFRRLVSMTASVPAFQREAFIAECLRQSTLVECVDDRVRRRAVPIAAPAADVTFSADAPAFVPREHIADDTAVPTSAPSAPAAAAAAAAAPPAAEGPSPLTVSPKLTAPVLALSKGVTPPRLPRDEWSTAGRKPRPLATKPPGPPKVVCGLALGCVGLCIWRALAFLLVCGVRFCSGISVLLRRW